MPSNSVIYELMHNRGSPISSTIAEIYLQFLEEIYIKQWLESKEIIYYKRYVDIFIIFNQNKTNEKTAINHVNNIYKHLEFKISEEENNYINYLDLSIHRNTNSIVLGMYRKPTHTQTLPYNFLPTTLTNTTCSIQLLHKQNANTAYHKTG
jgi:hypothetical protein